MMRIFAAGASGAIGTRLVPQFVERGHDVIGTHRSPEHADRREPDAIVHQAHGLVGSA